SGLEAWRSESFDRGASGGRGGAARSARTCCLGGTSGGGRRTGPATAVAVRSPVRMRVPGESPADAFLASGYRRTEAPAPPPQAGAGGNRRVFEVAMKTPGEIEADICDGITRFEQEYMGRGPRTSAPTYSATSWSSASRVS